MCGSIFGIAVHRWNNTVRNLLALALMLGIAFGPADAELLPNTPQPQGGAIVGEWTAANIPVKAYAPAALVTAVAPLTFEGETNGTITFGSNGTVQADYTTLSNISAVLGISAVLSFPISVSVPDTSNYSGNYAVMSDTHQLVITRENEDTLRYTYTATADSLYLIRTLPVSELLESVPEIWKPTAIGLLNRYVTEDDPMKTVISFAKATPSADFTGDGTVDFKDFLAFVAAFGKAPGQDGYDARMDLDSSGGAIDFIDFLAFVNAYSN